MYPLTSSLRFALTLLILALLLPACGGSSNSTTSNDPVVETPNSGDTPTNLDPSVRKVSDIQTLASPGTPTMVFNSAGDGMAIWPVSSKGIWFYYSHYDHASGSWSRAERLASVTTTTGLTLKPQLVSSSTGFAAAWEDADSNLFFSLFHEGEWVTSQAPKSSDFTYLKSFQLVTNNQGYLVTWYTWTTNTNGYELYASVSQDGISWDVAKRLYFTDSENLDSLGTASNGTGYLVVINATEGNRLLGSFFDGSAWQNVEEILGPTDGYNSSYAARIASNGVGYSMVWRSVTTNSSKVLNRIYTPSGGWSSIHLVTDEASIVNDITSNGTGYCIVIRINNSNTLGAIVDSQGDGNWGTVQTLVSAVSIQQTTLVSDGEGYALVWNSHNYFDLYESIDYYASIYQNGEWVSTTDSLASFPINNYQLLDTAFRHDSAITFSGLNGEYILALKQKINETDHITTIQHDSSGGWSETEILENDPGAVTYPAIAANPREGISVIWHQVSDNGSDIATYRNQRLDKQWQGKQLLSEGSYWLGSSYDTNLTATNDGSTLAVWSQDRNGYQALFANIREGDLWQQAVVLSDSITETPPKIITNGTSFTITWEEQAPDDNYHLKALSFSVNEWSESIVQNISLLHQSADPIYMALASNGNSYMLLYADSTPLGLNLLARLFDGASWSEPTTITESAKNNSGYLQIESNGSSYLSAWLQYDHDTMNIYSSEFDGVNWSSRQAVTTDLELIAIGDFWYGYPDVPQLASNGEDYAIFWFDRGKVNSSFYTNEWSDGVEIGIIETRYLAHGETPSVISNGNGYAVAWVSVKDDKLSTLFANIYDGSAWRGVKNLSLSSGSDVMFDMTENNNLIKASGEKYAVIWGNTNDYSETAYHINARVFDGINWSDSSLLSNNSKFTDFQLASDSEGFLVAWLQNDGNDQNKIFKSLFTGSEWSSSEVIDENSLGKYDLTLLGDAHGYQAIWNRAELGGDPWVGMPWAKSGL
ncbi:MAG: hypothetical protein P8179_02165 [Candidatus Thiodiazotropha sp.]|jgi:hypothetical protein